MKQNEYRLIIASGSLHSTEYTLLPCEYIAGFHVENSNGGSLHIEERFSDSDSFRTVYDSEGKQLKWTTLASGAFTMILNNVQLQRVRFALSQAPTQTNAIF